MRSHAFVFCLLLGAVACVHAQAQTASVEPSTHELSGARAGKRPTPAIEFASRDLWIPTPCEFCIDPQGSGYDVVNNIMYRGQVRQAVMRHPATRRPWMDAFDSLFQRVFGISPSRSRVYWVRFPDGSRAKVAINDQSPTGFIDPDHVIDQNGHPIMTAANRHQYDGFAASFSTIPAADNFLANARNHGARIHGQGGRAVSCRWICEDAGKRSARCELECTRD